MTNQITRYALESECMFGSGFASTEYELSTGKTYRGPYLFEDRKAALDEIEEDKNDRGEADMDDNEEHVVDIIISKDGNVVDSFGKELLRDMANQFSITESDLKKNMACYFAASPEAKKSHNHGSGGPSI
jgi:hypothetical protein